MADYYTAFNFVGLSLNILGAVLGSGYRVPFVRRVFQTVIPRLSRAMDARRTLFERGDLCPEDRGFSELSELMLRSNHYVTNDALSHYDVEEIYLRPGFVEDPEDETLYVEATVSSEIGDEKIYPVKNNAFPFYEGIQFMNENIERDLLQYGMMFLVLGFLFRVIEPAVALLSPAFPALPS